MARSIPTGPILMQKLHILPSSFTFFVVLTVVFSVVTFLCGSRNKEKKKVRLEGKESKPAMKKMERRLSNKVHLMAKMISGKKVQDGGEAEELDDEAAVWKKAIIKGDKCRPLDFSGRILYDCNGNILPEYFFS